MRKNDKFINLVHDNRYDTKTTKEDIVKAYDDFVKKYNLPEEAK